MRKVVLALAVAVGCTLVGSPAWASHVGDKNCFEDFTFQEDAQAHLDAHAGDPDSLDADGDGVACESLPSRGGSLAATGAGAGQARGAPAVPSAGLAQTGSSTVTLALFGTGLVGLGAMLVRAGYVRVRAWSTTADTLTALERLFYRR